GLGGVPRRYFAFGKYAFASRFQGMQIEISYIAFLLGAAQLVFLFNFFWSLWKGKIAGDNPWDAASIEWSAPSPPPHGNWGPIAPSVYRWPYDYNLPGEAQDFTMQTASSKAIETSH